ncbi:MAG TPA: hypothetical protein ENG91_01355, partial [Desulfobacteraceae bacterium]|nr:hypothetical protein [Desulfobacteraceae bacterium]
MNQNLAALPPRDRLIFTAAGRSTILVLCSLILLLALQPPAAAAKAKALNRQQPTIWTVQAAVRFALANSPDIAVTSHRIAAARAAVREAQSAFYPRIGLSTSYSRTNNPMYSFGNILNQGVFNNTINFNDPGWSDNLDMTAGVN